MHQMLGLHISQFSSFKLSLRGLATLKPHCPKRALPITPDLMSEFLSFLDVTQASDATYWRLFLLALFLMSRKSNLVPVSANSFDRKKQLCRGDILINSNCLLVLFKWSKTNQFGQRIVKIPLLSIPHSPLCPVQDQSVWPLARKYLSSPPTSVESERLYSNAGSICSEIRNRLALDKVEKLFLFLRTNLNVVMKHV